MDFSESINRFFVILVVQWLTESFHKTEAIISRDLVLTPKQELQFRGKTIYYREQAPFLSDLVDNANKTLSTMPRTWERTLKHVTYVTLFANALETNVSELGDYETFMNVPYVIAERQRYEAPFGDIVTLASGRLELLKDNSFRFVEGNGGSWECGYMQACSNARVWALWQVQKVRHHDIVVSPKAATAVAGHGFGNKHNYRYEIKFNITPMNRNNNNNNNIQKEYAGHKQKHTFIQKEEDYPQSFARISYNNQHENAFATKRRDDKPMAQSTFLYSVFKAPSLPTPPLSTSLNTGEYLKDNRYTAQHAHNRSPPIKATPKIELFPNIYNSENFLKPTFRPNYQIKLSGAGADAGELPTLPSHYSVSLGSGITHHFHHHFYMSPSPTAGGGDGVGVAVTTNTQYQRPVAPAPMPATKPPEKSYYTPSAQHTSPAPLLLWQSPYIYGQKGRIDGQTTTHVPLLIYAAADDHTEPSRVADEVVAVHAKPFRQSPPLEEEIIRYSEPDPLYVEHSADADGMQLEAPEEDFLPNTQNISHNSHNTVSEEQTTKGQTDEAGVGTTMATTNAVLELFHEGSQKRHSFTNEQTNSLLLAEKILQQRNATQENVSLANAETKAPSTTTSNTSKLNTTTNLREHSRYNHNLRLLIQKHKTAMATTSTNQPDATLVANKSNPPRRRDTSNSEINDDSPDSTATEDQSKVKARQRYEDAKTESSNASNEMRIKDKQQAPMPLNHTDCKSTTQLCQTTSDEFYEVLTQKSVSKSVSIKVGDNGEEIPIMVNDEENNVKHNQNMLSRQN